MDQLLIIHRFSVSFQSAGSFIFFSVNASAESTLLIWRSVTLNSRWFYSGNKITTRSFNSKTRELGWLRVMNNSPQIRFPASLGKQFSLPRNSLSLSLYWWNTSALIETSFSDPINHNNFLFDTIMETFPFVILSRGAAVIDNFNLWEKLSIYFAHRLIMLFINWTSFVKSWFSAQLFLWEKNEVEAFYIGG